MRPAKTQISLGIRPVWSEFSLGIRPVWSESLLCDQLVAEDPSLLHADNEDSDRTGRMPRLIWVFSRRTLILLVLSWGGHLAVPWKVMSLFFICLSGCFVNLEGLNSQKLEQTYVTIYKSHKKYKMDRVKRIWYLSPMRVAKVQASLRVRAVSPEPPLRAHTTVSHEEPSDRKPDPWPIWMAGHAQLKFVMTECSKTQIRLTGLKW